MHESKLSLLKKPCFFIFAWISRIIMTGCLLGFRCTRMVWKGERLWERLGCLGKVPRDPTHGSSGVYNIQKLGNWVCKLLQGLQGILQETRVFYRKTVHSYRKSVNPYRKWYSPRKSEWRGRWMTGDGSRAWRRSNEEVWELVNGGTETTKQIKVNEVTRIQEGRCMESKGWTRALDVDWLRRR